MVSETEVVIVGQGLAGSCLAWRLAESGVSFVLVDEGLSWSSSLIAAGLVTPVSGRRLTVDERYEELWCEATEFYRVVEAATSTECFRAGRAVRFFQDEAEEQEYENRAEGYGPFIQTQRIPPKGIEMWPAGRLITPAFLAATQKHFESTQQYRRKKLNPAEDIKLTGSGVQIRSLDMMSSVVVFCQGAEGRGKNPWFPEVPDMPVRGDVLDVRIEGFDEERVIHRGIWLVPTPERGANRFLLGATYDREHPEPVISGFGREKLLADLRQIVDKPVEVIDHRAGVRPATRTRKVVSRFHETESRLAVLNGMGSKGTLYGPTVAKEMATRICRQLKGAGQEKAEAAPIRQPIRITEYVKERVASVLRPGDLAIDATCGNGHDTIFMAKIVGESGRVLAFDIQREAIDRTAQRVREHQLMNVELIHDSHDRIGHYLQERPARVVMFNLGYLPGSDKTVVTKSESTTKAIQAAVSGLASEGAVAVTVYRGHKEGNGEYERVCQLCEEYRQRGLTVEIRESDSAVNTSPVLFFIQRI